MNKITIDQIKELIKTLSQAETNDMEFRKDLAETVLDDEIRLLLKDEDIDSKKLVDILNSYL